MSYEPTNWKTGDVVTSTKLNKLEEGVANAGMVVPVFTIDEQQNITCNMTFAEISEAIASGRVAYAQFKYANIAEEFNCYGLLGAYEGGVNFTNIAVAEDHVSQYVIDVLQDGTIEKSEISYIVNS